MKLKQLPKHVRKAMGETLNKTEQRFAEYCEHRRLIGEIRTFQMKPDCIALSATCRYYPDAVITHNDGSFEVVDCKAAWVKTSKVLKKKSVHIHIEDDALVKIKWSASKFPEYTFSLYGLHHKTGTWTRKVIK